MRATLVKCRQLSRGNNGYLPEGPAFLRRPHGGPRELREQCANLDGRAISGEPEGRRAWRDRCEERKTANIAHCSSRRTLSQGCHTCKNGGRNRFAWWRRKFLLLWKEKLIKQKLYRPGVVGKSTFFPSTTSVHTHKYTAAERWSTRSLYIKPS